MGGAPRGAVLLLGRGADRRDERLRVAITLLLTTKSPHMLPVGEWVAASRFGKLCMQMQLKSVCELPVSSCF
jgi:hypothetical protein